MLAPRFSVGKTVDNSHPAPSGRCKHRLSLPLVRSCDCPAPLFRMGILLPQFAYNFHSLEHNNRWETTKANHRPSGLSTFHSVSYEA